MKYRKKPVVIEAWQFDPQLAGNRWHLPNVPDWLPVEDHFFSVDIDAVPTMEIKTLEGTMTAHKGDWIIKGVKGEFYPCKPDIFEATYEPVEE